MCPNVHSKEFVLSMGLISAVHIQYAYLLALHQFVLSNIRYILNTPASSLGCSLGPPECETKVSLKNFGLGYVKMHGFHGNP